MPASELGERATNGYESFQYDHSDEMTPSHGRDNHADLSANLNPHLVAVERSRAAGQQAEGTGRRVRRTSRTGARRRSWQPSPERQAQGTSFAPDTRIEG